MKFEYAANTLPQHAVMSIGDVMYMIPLEELKSLYKALMEPGSNRTHYVKQINQRLSFEIVATNEKIIFPDDVGFDRAHFEKHLKKLIMGLRG